MTAYVNIAAPARPARRHAVQALLWGGYGALWLLLAQAYLPAYSGTWVIVVMLCGGLWLGTEALRAVVLRRRWLELPAPALIARLLLALVVVPVLIQLAIFVVLQALLWLQWITLPGGRADYRAGPTIVYLFNTAVLFGLWMAAWAGISSWRRYRHGELARLRTEAERSALEFDALRARLNPHFVFNALNNLRALINEDTERARDMVTRLSNTLRHALDHGAQASVPLAHELAVVDDYLAIEAVHYEQRLRVVRAVAPAALQAELPPMLLQLLVENAIKHGIARTPGGGELRIAAAIVDGGLRLQVDNPGRLDPPADRRGVGLAYLRARLAQTLPGARFELSEAGGGVRAVLTLPLREARCGS